eukprot:g5593.t1
MQRNCVLSHGSRPSITPRLHDKLRGKSSLSRTRPICVLGTRTRKSPISLTRSVKPVLNRVTPSTWACKAAVSDASEQPSSEKSTVSLPYVKMTGYIICWYAFNVVFNIYNKQALNAFTCPWFVAVLQLGASCFVMSLLWILGLQKKPKVSGSLLKALAPVALFHSIGHVSACVSFSKMAVSFAHIVKSAEPIFSVALSGPILNETYPLAVWLSLIPIAFGCSLAAMKEISFTWGGFNSAMISNLGMVFRGIYSKKALNDFRNIDGINLFALISFVSLLYCLPLAIVVEGGQWASAWSASVQAIGGQRLWFLLATSGLFYHLYNQASYMVLGLGIVPVTFSVCNTMKRVAVVVSSILFFKNPVSLLNWIGSGVAILGTLLYSLAKGQPKKPNKE